VKKSKKTCRRFQEPEVKAGKAKDFSSRNRSQGYMLAGFESGHGAASST
jgi:hypothetical protein